MPSVATWWCGEPAALKEVVAKVDRLVIKGAFPQQRVEPMFGEDLDERGKKRVIAMLRSRPNDYVAQELVQLSQAPVWDRAHPRLLPRSIGLRVFACATPSGYVVMPGGLTRVASAADTRVISMQRGGSSKDTWVLASGPVSSFSLLRRSIQEQDLVRAGTNLSSRGVENLFWFGRYCERSESTARLLRVALGRFGDNVPGDDDERARPVMLELLRRAGILPAAAAAPDDKELSAALRAAITDDAQPGLAANLRQLMRVASNPRSIAFQVQGLRDYARRLSDLFGDFGDERFHGALKGLLQLDPGKDFQPGNERLLARLDDWQAAAYRHGEQLGLRFFSHVGEASSQTFAT